MPKKTLSDKTERKSEKSERKSETSAWLTSAKPKTMNAKGFEKRLRKLKRLPAKPLKLQHLAKFKTKLLLGDKQRKSPSLLLKPRRGRSSPPP